MAEEKQTPEQKEQETLMAAMGLIANGGNAKSLAFEAIRLAKKGDIDGAREKLKESDKSLLEAHNSQTNMLTKEAQGDHMHVTLLVVHSQDHLMNAITFRDLAGEMVDLYEKLYKSGSLKKED
ncbi:PTS lactose/cellobiose transporter subunit IIA [Lactobacillus amylovorus]|jgi:PTS system cellobiose-specific IIA component|uniref:PTS lactose/cellobiose transporter subunit IIA n=4 Tax=Lactobacillus TaxID=1578 RepID=A0A413DD73_LACAM|nr:MULTISPECIES: PTS lactose/cellobiose transporter subunit IIA [Lactobacillus]ATO53875.1 PTS cellobiose transporter subunit IIA [Lactobacillus amylovorus DSM 20531]KRK41694.1 cellobiose-specific PTS IIA [Lactobacillus amylovorus DSM 20531]KRM02294.1 cellobiose-specific PTS IIA [Lactobacillus kitasatonis DSM 16761 = JCM 1039]MBL1072197.1 PTS lactose/cellobiose transporter subunit IIA [Lactobacillus kitasatonis]MCH3996543.1 PTS lactose/cellobiose transporter subunit IIA [Lactobacillus amylovoru